MKYRFTAVAALAVCANIACTQTTAPNAAGGPVPETVKDAVIKDIRNAVFTKQTPDCAAYEGAYHSDVTDLSRNMPFEGEVTISVQSDACILSVNQIPNHDFGGARWPREVAENSEVLRIPRNPKRATQTTPVGLTPGAILLNGVKWEANPAACFGEGNETPGRERIGCSGRLVGHPWRYNVGSPLNEFRFDAYLAHVQRGGMYHYHGTPRVLYSENATLFDNAACAGAGNSPVIGFALDGFPLYGPCFTDETGNLRAARSSYALKTGERTGVEGYTTPYVTGLIKSDSYNGQFVGDFEYIEGLGDLDACNGRSINGRYGYVVTSEFPYALRCFSGAPIIPSR